MSRSDLLHSLAARLIGERATLAVAESCTGGNIAASLSSVPGASGWLHTGIVSYMRASKKRVLGLSETDLSDGLVSEKTATAMAAHVRDLAGTTYGLATTGVCGPSADEGIKPTAAWIGIATSAGCSAEWVELPDEGRQKNQANITDRALRLLLEHLERKNRE